LRGPRRKGGAEIVGFRQQKKEKKNVAGRTTVRKTKVKKDIVKGGKTRPEIVGVTTTSLVVLWKKKPGGLEPKMGVPWGDLRYGGVANDPLRQARRAKQYRRTPKPLKMGGKGDKWEKKGVSRGGAFGTKFQLVFQWEKRKNKLQSHRKGATQDTQA